MQSESINHRSHSGAKPDAHCDRCGRPLRLAERRKEESKPFRRAKVPQGVCPDCVVTEFIYNTYPVNMIIDERGPDILLHPLAGKAFKMTILQGCEMDASEINWQRVVDNWKLPVRQLRGAKNPYTMGEAARRREAGVPRSGLYAREEIRQQEKQAAAQALVDALRHERKMRGEDTGGLATVVIDGQHFKVN